MEKTHQEAVAILKQAGDRLCLTRLRPFDSKWKEEAAIVQQPPPGTAEPYAQSVMSNGSGSGAGDQLTTSHSMERSHSSHTPADDGHLNSAGCLRTEARTLEADASGDNTLEIAAQEEGGGEEELVEASGVGLGESQPPPLPPLPPPTEARPEDEIEEGTLQLHSC